MFYLKAIFIYNKGIYIRLLLNAKNIVKVIILTIFFNYSLVMYIRETNSSTKAGRMYLENTNSSTNSPRNANEI